MKKGIFFLIGTLLAIEISANINFLDISKINNEGAYVTAFNFIKDNQQYYDHWANEWNYDRPKADFIKKLRDYYSLFAGIGVKNTEVFLLLGDISHYLYNLDDTAYFQAAVNNYNRAIKNNPNDFRSYWFLGYHYALSDVPELGIENFRKAQQLLPTEQPADFWNDFAWATAAANMPSNCIFAMDKVKSISGKAGTVETQLGPTIYKRIVQVDKDQFYKKEDIWTVTKRENLAFTCRPLGIKILIDSAWGLSANDYENHQGVFIINPPAVKNVKGKEIHFTMALIMKVANNDDKLADFINNFVSKYSTKNRISFSDKYDKMIGYEMKDHTIYQDIGGGHLMIIGVERNAPKNPGLLLEEPSDLPETNSGQVNYYSASESKNRFQGKIFYAIMLDSCEDIYEESSAIFKSFFDHQIIIE